MTPRSPWEVLGLAATSDLGAIRRAYAAQLKRTHPEEDSAGFQRLREAYEWAIATEGRAVPTPAEPLAAEAHGRAETRASPPPEVEAAPAAEASLADLHAQACNALADGVRAGAAALELQARLTDVLSCPAMERIDIAARTQEWLVLLAHHGRPASDALVGPIMAHFDWGEHSLGWSGDTEGHAAAMVALRQRIAEEQAAEAFAQRCRDRRHEYHHAWRALQKPVRERRFWSKLVALRIVRTMARLLLYTQDRHPPLFAGLDAESVVWWRDWYRRLAWLIDWSTSLLILIAFLGIATFAVLTRPDAAPQGPPRNAEEFLAAVQSDQTPQRLVELCRTAAKLELEADLAGRACKLARQAVPDSLRVGLYDGVRLLRAQQPDAAEAQFDAVLAKSPTDPYALVGKGLARRLLGEEDLARRLIGQGVAGAQSTPAGLGARPIAPGPSARAFFEAYSLELGAHDITSPPEPPQALGPRFAAPAEVTRPLDQAAIDRARMALGLDPLPAGRVRVLCAISLEGAARDCVILAEAPRELGLGELALRLAEQIGFRPATLDGAPVDGAAAVLPFVFSPEEQEPAP